MSAQEKSVVVLEPQASQVPAAVTPMQMVAMAIDKAASIETLERLMALQERWQAAEAKKAYVEAKALFYAEAPTITKNKHVGFESKRTGGDTSYWHATLDHVVEMAAPILAKHGLTHAWSTTQDEKGIEVACVLTHVMGHSERVALKGPPEMSGTKNAIQGIGSTVTFLERYTFLAVTGLAAKNQDNDGGPPVQFVTVDQGLELEQMAQALAKELPGDFSVNLGKVTSRFLQAIKAETIAMIPASKFSEAKQLLSRPPRTAK